MCKTCSRGVPFALLLALICLPARAAEPTKIAVLDLAAQTELPKGMVKLLNEMILSEVEAAGDLKVLGSSDIASILTLEQQKVQMTGCADNECLAEIGGALGVNLLLSSSLGTVGSNYIFNIKILDVSSAGVVKRATEVIEKDDDQLIKSIKFAVATVVAPLTGKEAPERPEEVARVEPTPAGPAEPVATLTAEPESSGSALPWVALGVTGALAVAGAAVLGAGGADYSAMGDETKGSPDWRDLKDTSETKVTAGGVLLGVAGAAAVATIVIFVLDGRDEPAASAGVAPTRGGAFAAVGGRF